MRYFTLVVFSIIISLSLIPNGIINRNEFIVTQSMLSIGRDTMGVYGEIQNVGHRTHYVPSVYVYFYVNNNFYAFGSTYCDAAMLVPLDTCNFGVQLVVAAPTGQVTYTVSIGSVLQV